MVRESRVFPSRSQGCLIRLQFEYLLANTSVMIAGLPWPGRVQIGDALCGTPRNSSVMSYASSLSQGALDFMISVTHSEDNLNGALESAVLPCWVWLRMCCMRDTGGYRTPGLCECVVLLHCAFTADARGNRRAKSSFMLDRDIASDDQEPSVIQKNIFYR